MARYRVDFLGGPLDGSRIETDNYPPTEWIVQMQTRGGTEKYDRILKPEFKRHYYYYTVHDRGNLYVSEHLR